MCMYYWLQNDVRPPMAGRLTGTVGCAASHPGSAAQYIPLASCSPQTRWAGSETRRSGRPAYQISVAKMPAANHLQTCVDLSMTVVTITSPRNYLQQLITQIRPHSDNKIIYCILYII